MKILEAREWLVDHARNANAEGGYDDYRFDRAIIAACSKYRRLTGFGIQKDELTQTADETEVDFSVTTDFLAKDLKRVWVDGEPALTITSHQSVLDSRLTPAPEGWGGPLVYGGPRSPLAGKLIGFITETLAELDFAWSEEKTINFTWQPPFTVWTPGQEFTGPDDPLNLELNLPNDEIQDVLIYGATAVLQHTEPEHGYALESNKEFMALVRRGSNTLPVQAVPRDSVRLY